VGQFSYVVETERRFYLANSVELRPQNADGEVYFEVRMSDAWGWDMYRPARFVKHVRVITFKDVNIEELEKPDLRLPEEPRRLSTAARLCTGRCKTPPRVLAACAVAGRDAGAGDQRALGGRGEALAARFLRDAGMEIVARNWRCRHGELDLIARHGAITVFVEVKTRRTLTFGTPAEAVTVGKQQRIRRLALLWLAEQDGPWQPIRFDVVSVLMMPGQRPRIDHLAAVF